MNIHIAKFRNPSQQAIKLGDNSLLQPGSSIFIFMNRKMFTPVFDWNIAFASGLEALDFEGNPISAASAIPACTMLQYLSQSLSTDLSGNALWNIEVSKYLIGATRTEILKAKLSDYGTTWQSVMTKLQTVSNLLLLGMFNEASLMLLTITPDEFLTTERLTRWSNMCSTADAIKGD